MSIVLRENEWAQKMIESGDLGKKPSDTLRRVARYYLDAGKTPAAVRQAVESFIIKCDPDASLPGWDNAIDWAIKRAKKISASDIRDIQITDTEIEKISLLDGKQIQRLAFTLLCLAKYWAQRNPDSDFWVNCKDNEIMSLANISTSIRRQSLMYWTLREAGMIQFSKKVDNTNVRVCFADSGDIALRITDFRNLGYQYLMYCGDPYFKCSGCGITAKIKHPQNNRKPKYCPECAAKIDLQRRVDAAMRYKTQTKTQKVEETNAS